MKRRILISILALLGSIHLPGLAQEFGHPIRLVVPAPPGGSVDILARTLAPLLSRDLGQPVIVLNRPGASGQIAAQFVKASSPDGSTFFLTTEQPLVVMPFITPNIGYVPERDFVAVGKIANLQWVLSVPEASGVKDVAQYIARAKSDLKLANVGIPLIGGVPAQIGVEVGRHGGVDITSVPFAGGFPIIQALSGGQIEAGVTGVLDTLAMVKSGKIRILAVAGPRRSSFVPNVPTFGELGISGLEVNSWIAVFAPSGIPAPLVVQFNKALNAALNDPDVRQKISDVALEIAPDTLPQAEKEFSDSLAFWRDRLKVPDKK